LEVTWEETPFNRNQTENKAPSSACSPDGGWSGQVKIRLGSGLRNFLTWNSDASKVSEGFQLYLSTGLFDPARRL
jgi:hypothetical protein